MVTDRNHDETRVPSHKGSLLHNPLLVQTMYVVDTWGMNYDKQKLFIPQCPVSTPIKLFTVILPHEWLTIRVTRKIYTRRKRENACATPPTNLTVKTYTFISESLNFSNRFHKWILTRLILRIVIGLKIDLTTYVNFQISTPILPGF